MNTVRQHLEEIRDECHLWPDKRIAMFSLAHAEAALTLINDAARVDAGPLQHALERFRLVPDPDTPS